MTNDEWVNYHEKIERQKECSALACNAFLMLIGLGFVGIAVLGNHLICISPLVDSKCQPKQQIQRMERSR